MNATLNSQDATESDRDAASTSLRADVGLTHSGLATWQRNMIRQVFGAMSGKITDAQIELLRLLLAVPTRLVRDFVRDLVDRHMSDVEE